MRLSCTAVALAKIRRRADTTFAFWIRFILSIMLNFVCDPETDSLRTDTESEFDIWRPKASGLLPPQDNLPYLVEGSTLCAKLRLGVWMPSALQKPL